MLAVSPRAFMAMQNLAPAGLAKCTESELRPLLPCLVRTSTLNPVDKSKETNALRAQILRQVIGIEKVNKVMALLQIDFQELETDIRKEQQLRYLFCVWLFTPIVPFLTFSSLFISIVMKLQTKNRIHQPRFSPNT